VEDQGKTGLLERFKGPTVGRKLVVPHLDYKEKRKFEEVDEGGRAVAYWGGARVQLREEMEEGRK